MRRSPDISIPQFNAACAREGFTTEGILGYFDLGIPGRRIHVSIFNAGPRRRDQLAYLMRERDRFSCPAHTDGRETPVKSGKAPLVPAPGMENRS